MSVLPKNTNWLEAAHSLHQSAALHDFEPDVLEQLRGASKALIACSGGADSVYLLCMLVAKRKGPKLIVAHYNHRWREQESDADAAFVESLSRDLDLAFICGNRPESVDAFNETTARKLRLDFLRQSARKHKCDVIVFGHHLDDIIETQLQRIARGCASDGLAAPRPVVNFEGQAKHLRPLINIRSKDIRVALAASSIPWREDSTNDDMSIPRNSLRKLIIPKVADLLGRDISLGAARTRRLLEEDARALDEITRKQYPDAYSRRPVLQRSALRLLHPALLRRALTQWLSGHNLINSVGPSALDILIDTLKSTRTTYRMSAGSKYIIFDAETISFQHIDNSSEREVLQPVCIEVGKQIDLINGALIKIQKFNLCKDTIRQVELGRVDSNKEAIISYEGESSFIVRSCEQGDRYFPLGAPGNKKLKKWFIDRKIPKLERKTYPVVINASGLIVWVPGFAPAESCKVKASTKEALRLTYQIRDLL